MRKISSVALLTATVLATPAAAQQSAGIGQPVYPSQSTFFNQHGLNLPSAPSVHGQDVVRGSSGVTCQSATASGGPYVDMGMIGSEDPYDRGTTATYGRLVVPLGKRPKRIDCTRLYELEIARLEVELALLRMGTGLSADEIAKAAAPAPQPAVDPVPATTATPSAPVAAIAERVPTEPPPPDRFADSLALPEGQLGERMRPEIFRAEASMVPDG